VIISCAIWVSAVASGRDVIAGVVDNVVRAEDADQIQLRRAADAGDVGAGRLGDLYGERPHAAGRAYEWHGAFGGSLLNLIGGPGDA
jgi:hypothetical protein